MGVQTRVQMLTAARAAVALMIGMAAVLPRAQAGLFDDEEARKAILDLRARMQANDEALRSKLAADLAQTQAQAGEQQQQLRRMLVELSDKLDGLRAEQVKLLAAQEQLKRDVAALQTRQGDAQTALEQRLTQVEPVKVTLDGRDFLAEPAERRAHDQAMSAMREGDFDRAAGALAAFLQRWPQSGYADSVRYWLGNAQYGQKNHKDAILTFRSMVAAAPNHPRAAEAMLAIANSQAETKDIKGARKTLEELLKLYPASEAANAARERMAALKG